jgi:3',5'-nucleoside bisphosphate phosphatase
MKRWIDLHIHSDFSDGLDSPEEIAKTARKKQFTAFAICDHDNFNGYFEAKKVLGKNDPELISGTELSAGRGGEDIHILGYLFDPESPLFKKTLKEFRDARNRRGEKMVLLLRKMGIDIPIELVYKLAGKSAIGRPNVADALVQTGAVRKFDDAFEKYIGLDGPAYVQKENLKPKDAIDLIHKAEGLAFLAHPGVANAIRHIDEFIGYGLDGVEVYHPYHNNRVRKLLNEIAEKHSLLKSGGSDYHGRGRHTGGIGSMQVPAELLDKMKEKLNR